MGLDTLHENLLRRAVVGDLITRSAERFGDSIALVCREQRISFKEVNEKELPGGQRISGDGHSPGRSRRLHDAQLP